MRPTTRRSRNPRGEFVPDAQYQVETVEDQVAANAAEQRQIASPAENITNFGTVVSLKRWKIAVTPDRAQVFLWSSLMIINFISMLAMISFWICTIMCIKTLPTWNGPIAVFNGIMRRNVIRVNPGPAAYPPGDNIWADLFQQADAMNSYNLRLGLAQAGHADAELIYAYGIPLMLGHPLIWASAMTLLFLSYHFLSFIHGCIRRAHHATNVVARRRSS
jgi:hypothetical protein